MVEIIKLVRTDFDNPENHNAICKKDIAIFVGDEKTNAHKKCSIFLEQMKPAHQYLGWDGQVYPKFDAYVLQSTEVDIPTEDIPTEDMMKTIDNMIARLLGSDQFGRKLLRCKKYTHYTSYMCEVLPNSPHDVRWYEFRFSTQTGLPEVIQLFNKPPE